MSDKLSQVLSHIMGARRYCFVIMNYHDDYLLFDRLRPIVADVTGFECVRADEIALGSSEDLRGKVHAAIESAALVIAEISHHRPNIFYEVGYAIARQKPVLLLAREGAEIPTDLRGVELICYSGTREGLELLEKSLRQNLIVHTESSISLLRAMCVPQLPSPSYILVAPKPAQVDSRFQFHPYEERTYGDYLGVSGVLRAFAAVFGENHVPELLTASRAPKELENRDANLFLIGSHKNNPFIKSILYKLQQAGAANWESHAAPGEEEKERFGKDFEVQFSGELDGTRFSTPRVPSEPKQHREDYGLIIRGPHPLHPHRMVMILAGPHSLGTGAACLAATKSQLVREIGQRLAGMVDLAARDRTIWALVKGVTNDDQHIYPDGVTIERVGVYAGPVKNQ